MIFKKDNFIFGLILGFIAPILGFLVFKWVKFEPFTMTEFLRHTFYEDIGFRILTAGLSLSLIANAVIFTVYINAGKDRTAKGIFATTVVYGIIVLLIKTFA